jgi:hypothetical protein
VILLHYKFSLSICYLSVQKFTMTQIGVPTICFLCRRSLWGPPVTRVTRRSCFYCGGLFILIVCVAIIIALAATLLNLRCLCLIHHVTDKTSRPVPRVVPLCCRIWDVQHLFVVLWERSEHFNSKHLLCPC